LDTTNIFRIGTSDLGPEDRFTAFLHYLVESLPSVGQGMVDLICRKSGLAPATFQMSVDHPEGDAESKPDFMLSCKEFDILCEHKLDSDLGDRQLERYIGLPKKRPTHLVLITNRSHVISQDVVQSAHYLRPKDSPTLYFHWEDFYPIIATHRERLAQDFVTYMRDLGMAPCPLPGDWADLFHRREVADGFYDATKDMRTYFEKMGAQCKADPSRLGLQVKHPSNWLHLLYFYVSKVTKPAVAGVEPPFFIARFFVQTTELAQLQHLRETDIPAESGLIVGRAMNERATWNRELILSYECVGNLNNYIAESAVETREKLLNFGRTVFEHVTATAR
jgi:hypothetical protein